MTSPTTPGYTLAAVRRDGRAVILAQVTHTDLTQDPEPAEYEVTYRIDSLDAHSPRQAAEDLAAHLTHDGWAARGVYEVRPRAGGPGVQVDLSGELDDEPLPDPSGPGTLGDIADALPGSFYEPANSAPQVVVYTGASVVLVTNWDLQPGCHFAVGIYDRADYEADRAEVPVHYAEAITAEQAVHLARAFIEHREG